MPLTQEQCEIMDEDKSTTKVTTAVAALLFVSIVGAFNYNKTDVESSSVSLDNHHDTVKAVALPFYTLGQKPDTANTVMYYSVLQHR